VKLHLKLSVWSRRLATIAPAPDALQRRSRITDLAEQEGVTDAYVCRLLPLTCLAPDIAEAILVGRQRKGLRLAEMLGNGPLGWEEQRRRSSGAAAMHRLAETRGPAGLLADDRHL
jgi:hypothetical protein